MNAHILWVLDCHSEQLSDECRLTGAVSFLYSWYLTFPDHVHGLESLERSPCCLEGEEAHSRFRQPFHEAMILFDQIVEVLATPHLNELPLRILPPQKPKGRVTLLVAIERYLARPTR